MKELEGQHHYHRCCMHGEVGSRRFNLRIAVLSPLLFLILLCPFSNAVCSAEKVVLQLRWDHQFQFAGYYAALWQGYYREAGLDVEIRSAITPERKILRAVQEVAEGRADFGVGAADILVARDKGAPLVLLAVIFQQSAARFYALEKTGFRSPADLLRLRVARNVNDLIDVEFQAMLRAEGIDPARVKAYPHEPGIDHLARGRVDVVPGYSTTIPYYGDRRSMRLSSLAPSSYGIDFYGDSLFTHERVIKAKPAIVERFKQASLRGWRYAMENPVAVADRITRELPRLDTVDNVSSFNRFQIDQVTKLMLHPLVELGHVNEERWQRMQRTLRESGIVHGTLNSAAFFYDSSRQKREWLQRLLWIIPPVMGILVLIAALSLFWNRRLSREVEKRKLTEAALRESEARYRQSIGLTGQIGWGTRADGLIEDVTAWRKYTGQSLEEVKGWGWINALHPDDKERSAQVWKEAVDSKSNYETEYRVRRQDGVYRHFIARGIPVLNDEGSIQEWVGTCIDITERKQAEESIQVSLREKETLLKEIHHRVKNNLQVISSLLNMQSSHVPDEKARAALQESMARVRTMALIHTQLYQSQDLTRIDFGLFIRDLIGNISQSYGRPESPVTFDVDTQKISLSIDTSIPCGLILNELVSNALKHAFPNGTEGKIRITLSMQDHQAVLTVSDNGIGLPESIDLTNVTSLGLELVNILVRQMNGKIDRQVDGGTTWIITFPLKNEREWRNG